MPRPPIARRDVPSGYQERAEPPGRLDAIQPARRHVERQALPAVRIERLAREQAVLAEKDQTRGERHPLVAIDEGMIPAQIEQVRGSHLDRVLDQRPTHHRGLRRCHR